MKLPSDLTQTQWENACIRLGLIVDRNSGKGSHIKVTCKGKGATTIPSNIHPMINRSLCSCLQSWGFTEERIREALKIK